MAASGFVPSARAAIGGSPRDAPATAPRSTLAGGNGNEMKESIRGLMEMDIEWILSGHMGIVSGAEAVKMNFSQIENYFFNYI